MSNDSLRDQLQASLGTAYTLDRELGGGGMSRVFVAQENRLRRNVVVKVLSPELAAGVSAERFEREIQLAAALQQANIVPLLSAGDMNGLPYYTMPFVDGLTLRARLARSGAMPVAEVISVLRDVTRALAYAHEHGVVHRDIKPENILLSGDAAVVTDFGIAKALSASRTQAPGGTLTQVGTSIGTPAYMAPEQASGDPATDHRADIYALGCVAYEMLTGAPPFANRPTHQIFAAHLAEAPAPIAGKRADTPRELAALVMRCLEKDAARRPQGAREVLQALDATPSGSNRASGTARGRMPLIAAGAALLLVGAGGFYMLRQRGDATGATRDNSIAVLPFATGGDSAQTYFAEGVADELTTALARVPGLRVASRSAAFTTAKRSANAQDAGRALHVATVLEGSVRRSGRKLRITAQLTSVADGFALWSDAFERDTGDVFTAQDELSRHITAALHDKLSIASRDTVTTERGTRDPEAYDLYLRGRYLWTRRGEDGLLRAAAAFSSAIERDSSFARAWAGRALVQVVLPEYIEGRGDTLLAAGLKSADRAIALDANLGDAHLARGYGLISRWEWEESEASFKRALALDPLNPAVHHWYGDFLYINSRLPESLRELSEAHRLDPTSAIIASELSGVYYYMRRFDEALKIGRRSVVLDTLLGTVYSNVAPLYLYAKMPDSALAMYDRERRMTGETLIPRELMLYAGVLDHVGRAAEARRIAADLDDRARKGRIAAFWAGGTYAVIGDLDKAFFWLDRSVEQREAEPAISAFTCEPLFDPIRSDPRYPALLTRLKLKACPVR